MTELDQVWSQMLSEAAAKAVAAGESDIADYLRLKAANDVVRTTGVTWLIETFIEIASRETISNTNITIEREDPHNFAYGHSNMVGTLLEVRYGVRCLAVEAGWTRTPRDGIMRNGALAQARITHFGLPKHSAELQLVHGEALPEWLNKNNAVFDSNEIRRHMDLLLDK